MTTLTIELPEAVADRLREEAEAKGRSASSLLAEWVEARHAARERARAEAQAILNGPRHDFSESMERFRRKHGIPDYSRLSPEELAEQARADLAWVSPERLAEAERLGLI